MFTCLHSCVRRIRKTNRLAVSSNNIDGFFGVVHTDWNIYIFDIDKRSLKREHRVTYPLDETRPQLADENQRRLFDMPNLKQLPDHHRLQNCPDAARSNDEGVRREYEVM